MDFDRKAFLKEAEAVVLRGLAKGYASGAKAIPVPGNPNAKYYEYTEGPWYLRDDYEIDPVTKKSIGRVRLEHTSDEYPNRLVWAMSYGGQYEKDAVPCLKAALMANYEKGVFNFGRGLNEYVQGDYVYMIASMGPPTFEKFFAREGIVRRVGSTDYEIPKHVGGHAVWGMALV